MGYYQGQWQKIKAVGEEEGTVEGRAAAKYGKDAWDVHVEGRVAHVRAFGASVAVGDVVAFSYTGRAPGEGGSTQSLNALLQQRARSGGSSSR